MKNGIEKDQYFLLQLKDNDERFREGAYSILGLN
jgi:hypothetical protein